MRKAVEAWRPSSAPGVTSCQIAGITLGALVLGLVLMNIPDFLRYLRIRNM